MTINENNKNFLLEWNYKFPLDKWFRKKYNIPLFSKKHLEISQIDIALEYLEDKLYEYVESIAAGAFKTFYGYSTRFERCGRIR